MILSLVSRQISVAVELNMQPVGLGTVGPRQRLKPFTQTRLNRQYNESEARGA